MSQQSWCPNGHGAFTGFTCPICALIEESRAREERERKEREKADKKRRAEEERQRLEEQRREEQESEDEYEESEEEALAKFRSAMASWRERSQRFNEGCDKAAKLILSEKFDDAMNQIRLVINDIKTSGSDRKYDSIALLPYFLLFEIRSRTGIDGTAELLKDVKDVVITRGMRWKLPTSSLEQLKKIIGQERYPERLRYALKTLRPWTSACAFCEESDHMSRCYVRGKTFCSQHGQIISAYEYRWHRCQEHLLIPEKFGEIDTLVFFPVSSFFKIFGSSQYFHGVIADNVNEVIARNRK